MNYEEIQEVASSSFSALRFIVLITNKVSLSYSVYLLVD